MRSIHALTASEFYLSVVSGTALGIILVAGCGGISSSSSSKPPSPPGGGNSGGGNNGGGGNGGGGSPPSTSTFIYTYNQSSGSTRTIFALKLNTDGTVANMPGSPFSDPNFLAHGQSGKFLIGNSASSHLTVYSVNTQTGVPESPVNSVTQSGGGVTDGTTLYLSAADDNGLNAYSISSSGQLTLVPGSPFDPIKGTFFIKSYEQLQIVGSVSFGSFNTVKDAGNITAFSRAPNGALTRIGELGNGNTPFGFVVHPNARFVYVVNDVNFLDVYSFDSSTGSSTRIQSVPDNSGGFVVVDPSGKFLLMHDNGIREFSIDQNSGKLTEMPGSPFLAGDNSIHNFDFDPSGHFLVVVRQNTVTAMTFNANGAFVQAAPPTTVGDNLLGVQFAVF